MPSREMVEVSNEYWKMHELYKSHGKSDAEADKLAREHLQREGWVKKNGKWYNPFLKMKGKKKLELFKKKPKIKTDWEGEKIAKGKSNGRHG